MRKEYEKLIENHDKTLLFLREHWLKEKVGSEKSGFMSKINDALDERNRLTKEKNKYEKDESEEDFLKDLPKGPPRRSNY